MTRNMFVVLYGKSVGVGEKKTIDCSPSKYGVNRQRGGKRREVKKIRHSVLPSDRFQPAFIGTRRLKKTRILTTRREAVS